ncbi:hypothetical protein SETIT_2G269100v2 [Setaria italica]|uniref:Uncharacterized protein n=1 Tax=Setaria italica TaxID=4555 RepID=A0A368Q5A4_SETIT|nr:hypothetical protein SETIT_2G269100v2 [Setaria italica]
MPGSSPLQFMFISCCTRSSSRNHISANACSVMHMTLQKLADQWLYALTHSTWLAEPGQELEMFVQTKCSRVLLYFARSKGHEGSRAGVLVEGHVQVKKEHAIICLLLSIFFSCKVKLDRWLCNRMTLIFSCIVFHLN